MDFSYFTGEKTVEAIDVLRDTKPPTPELTVSKAADVVSTAAWDIFFVRTVPESVTELLFAAELLEMEELHTATGPEDY